MMATFDASGDVGANFLAAAVLAGNMGFRGVFIAARRQHVALCGTFMLRSDRMRLRREGKFRLARR